MNENIGSDIPGTGNRIRDHTLAKHRLTILFVALAMIMGLSFGAPKAVAAQGAGQKSDSAGGSGLIVNDRFWNDVDGNPMYMQGGGIFDFPDPATGKVSHFWYGVHFPRLKLIVRTQPMRSLAMISSLWMSTNPRI